MLLIALVTTAVLMGGGLLRPSGLGAGLEGALFRILLGLLVAVTLLLPVATVSLGAAGGLLITAAVIGMTREVFRKRVIRVYSMRPAGPPLDGIEVGCAVALAAIGLTVIIRALAPPIDPEALVIHLALAKEAVLEGRLTAIDRHPLSNGLDLGRAARAMLYLWRSTLTVTLWQALTAALAVTALYALVRRMATRRAGLLAATGFAAMPAVLTVPLTASNDLLAAAFLFAALIALLRWRQEGQSLCGVLSGLLMGGACAAGAIGWMALPGWMLVAGMFGPHGAIRGLAIAGLPALAAAGVWALVATPMPADLSGLEALRAWIALTATPPVNLMEAAVPPAWQVPDGRLPYFAWDSVMRPALFEGPWFSPGPLAIAVGLPALLFCGRDGRRIGLFAVTMGLAVALLHPSVRLLMPASALLIAVAAVGIERNPRIRRVGLAAFAVAIAFGLAMHGMTAAGCARVVAGLETRDEWRARHLPIAPALAWCNIHCGEGVVLSLDPHGFLLDSPVFSDHAALESIAMSTVWRQTHWLSERGIRYIIYPESAVRANRAMRAAGIPAMVNRWRRTPNRFIQRAVFQHEDGPIYIYEVRDAVRSF